jgi:hypothetical protein
MTFTEISGKLPMEIYPVFPPVNSFALEILYGENALNQMISRLEHCQALLLPGRGIHCSDLKSGASLVFPVPERIRMVKSFSLGGVEKWNLFPLEGLQKEPGEYEYIFFLGRNLPLEEMRLLPEGKKFINFRQNSFRKEGGSFLCLLPGKDVKYSLARLRKMEENSSGCFRCLVFRENSISAR